MTSLARELAKLLAEALAADAKAYPDPAQAPAGPETAKTRAGSDREARQPRENVEDER